MNVHRARRITASNFYSVIHTRNSISLLDKLMQYETPSSDLPNLKYCREMEKRVRGSFHTLFGPTLFGPSMMITLTWVPLQMEL